MNESKYITTDVFDALLVRVHNIAAQVKDIDWHVRTLSEWAGGKLRRECTHISFHDYVGLASGEAWKNDKLEDGCYDFIKIAEKNNQAYEEIKRIYVENNHFRKKIKELLSKLEGLEK